LKGLYIHVPFCARKCAYCDFYSLAGRGESREAYVEAVLREANVYTGQSFQTLYLGGGTPSLLGANLLKRLVTGLKEKFDLSELEEATIEVNPDSATQGFLKAARKAGITRFSIGVQSLADSELKSAGRIHTAAQAFETVCLVKEAGFKAISTDLIAGLPGQNWSSLKESLKTLVGLGVGHISLYCLSLEEGTPMAIDPPKDLPSEDEQAELFDQARIYLKDSSFAHYEISNFVLPGQECRHNLNYWHGGEYVGLGPAASSHLNGKRFKNRADLDAYIRAPTSQMESAETLSPEAKAAEEAMLRLRLLNEGLSLEKLAVKFGSNSVVNLKKRLDRLAGKGSLDYDGSKYVLPPSRVLTSNPILAEVVAD
jgi:oxygen-independent coproporphyrinogen-3 oxidase